MTRWSTCQRILPSAPKRKSPVIPVHCPKSMFLNFSCLIVSVEVFLAWWFWIHQPQCAFLFFELKENDAKTFLKLEKVTATSCDPCQLGGRKWNKPYSTKVMVYYSKIFLFIPLTHNSNSLLLNSIWMYFTTVFSLGTYRPITCWASTEN